MRRNPLTRQRAEMERIARRAAAQVADQARGGTGTADAIVVAFADPTSEELTYYGLVGITPVGEFRLAP